MFQKFILFFYLCFYNLHNIKKIFLASNKPLSFTYKKIHLSPSSHSQNAQTSPIVINIEKNEQNFFKVTNEKDRKVEKKQLKNLKKLNFKKDSFFKIIGQANTFDSLAKEANWATFLASKNEEIIEEKDIEKFGIAKNFNEEKIRENLDEVEELEIVDNQNKKIKIKVTNF